MSGPYVDIVVSRQGKGPFERAEFETVKIGDHFRIIGPPEAPQFSHNTYVALSDAEPLGTEGNYKIQSERIDDSHHPAVPTT